MSSSAEFLPDTTHGGSGYLDLDVCDEKHSYTGLQQFWAILNLKMHQQHNNQQDCDEYVLFTDVDEEKTFTRDFLHSPADESQRSWVSYDRIKHLLLAIMPLRAHDAAGFAFEQILLDCLRPMRLNRMLQGTGSGDRDGEDGVKRPDRQHKPMRTPRGRPEGWPSVVLEVTLSESSPKLMTDVRYWLRQLNGVVHVVFTIQINRRTPEIIVEKWERHGNINSNHDSMQPQRKLTTVIRMMEGKRNGQIAICGDELTLDFDKLFLRAPQTAKEGDIHFAAEDLRYFARVVWNSQGFLSDEDFEATETETEA